MRTFDYLPIESIEVALECGHTLDLHPASSAFEFPADPLRCSVCKASRLMADATAAEFVWCDRCRTQLVLWPGTVTHCRCGDAFELAS